MNTIPNTESALRQAADDLREVPEAVREDLHRFKEETKARTIHYAEAVGRNMDQTVEQVRVRMIHKPVQSLACAFGAGFVLGFFLRR